MARQGYAGPIRTHGGGAAFVHTGEGASEGADRRPSEAQPPDSVPPPCGASFDFILDNFSFVTAVREALTASGECAEIDWSLFGLAMPAWVLLALLALTAWAVWTNSFARQRTSPPRPTT
ncbi:MAG: disulfide bond formation protein B [Gammaproteobacteria bacterium]|nr:disulfide bond formation protein B [Gammaproteobacteria bacterium]